MFTGVVAQLQGWRLGLGKGGQESGAERAAAGRTARQSWGAFSVSSLGCPIPIPTPVCLSGHIPQWLGDALPGTCWGRDRTCGRDTYFTFSSGTNVSWSLPVVFSASAICSASLFSCIYCVISQKNVVAQKQK